MTKLDRTRRIFLIIVGAATIAIVLAIIWPDPPPTPTPTPPEPGSATLPQGTEPQPTGGTVEVLLLTSDTKAEWIDTVTAAFNEAQIQTEAGSTIIVQVVEEGSPADAQQALLDGEIQPVVWSPGDMSWVETANQVSRDRGLGPLVTEDCPQTVYAATGFAMWRPMAEALGWPDTPIGWADIVNLAADPKGWATYGHPEWGQFKFGHTHPEHSNTGFSLLANLAYAALERTTGLTPELVKSDPVIEAFHKVELNTYHYGTSTRLLMNAMAERGPAYLHAVTASETAVLKNNEVVPDKRWPYVFIFPAEGTFWSDNPFCILETDWVNDEQREAAVIFRDYLLQPEQQDIAVDIGLRPADPTVALHAPIALDYGTDPGVSPEIVPPLEGVSGETASAVIDVFRSTKKKATVVIVLDTSLSMEGEKISEAIKGTVEFIKRLDRDDQVITFVFNDEVQRLNPSGRVGEVREQLSVTLNGLFADGNTVLFDAVCESVDLVNRLKKDDESAGQKRLYGIVLLSDGDDSNSSRTENDMFGCLPYGEDVEGVKIFTIAYGENANEELLLRIANRTNGRSFTADPATIEDIFLAISSEQ